MITKLTNISQALTLKNAYDKNGRGLVPNDKSIINNASLVFDNEKILWIGPENDFPSTKFKVDREINLEGHVLTPRIVDSHTHLVFAGDRATEYTMRMDGASYEEIALAGGGILASAQKTISTPEEVLLKESITKVERILSYGIGAIEIKSGYGLTYESEKKLSTVIHKLKEHFKGRVQIINTFMAAHAVPLNFKSSKSYMQELVIPLLNELAPKGVIDIVDIFHEQNYFDSQDCELLFSTAKALGIKCKIHADELNTNGGAELAAKHELLSADHLLKISDKGIAAIANSNTIATLLPGTAFFLGKDLPPARKLLDKGCRVAIASDYNPGSSHCDNLVLISSLAGKNLNMNSCELWAAITLNASAALGLENQGALCTGMKPYFTIFKTSSVDDIFYNWGKNLATREIFQ